MVVLLALFTVYVVTAEPFTYSSGSAQGAVVDYLHALQAGRTGDAYALLTLARQQQTPPARFDLDAAHLAAGPDRIRSVQVLGDSKVRRKPFVVKVEVVIEHAQTPPITRTVTITGVGNGWRVEPAFTG